MPSQPATEVKSEQRDELPFAVVALGVPGALLVADAFQRKREARLARDLIRAARRDWSAGAGQARFDWPQPGVTGASARALAAFIEKQSEDHEARLTLVTESVAGRLGNIPFEFVTVPDLASLGEPANKAALWRFFQGLVLEADR